MSDSGQTPVPPIDSIDSIESVLAVVGVALLASGVTLTVVNPDVTGSAPDAGGSNDTATVTPTVSPTPSPSASSTPTGTGDGPTPTDTASVTATAADTALATSVIRPPAGTVSVAVAAGIFVLAWRRRRT